jgi:imidazoleglycerol-phosphate dehydratase
VPLDEALAMVAVDISGRGYAVIDLQLGLPRLGDMLSDLIRHFLQTFAYEGRLNLHAKVLAGVNDHHKAEATFKALAKSLSAAVKVDPRLAKELPSTKGVIEG